MCRVADILIDGLIIISQGVLTEYHKKFNTPLLSMGLSNIAAQNIMNIIFLVL